MLVSSGERGTLSPWAVNQGGHYGNVLFVGLACASLPLDSTIKWAH